MISANSCLISLFSLKFLCCPIWKFTHTNRESWWVNTPFAKQAIKRGAVRVLLDRENAFFSRQRVRLLLRYPATGWQSKIHWIRVSRSLYRSKRFKWIPLPNHLSSLETLSETLSVRVSDNKRLWNSQCDPLSVTSYSSDRSASPV